MEKKLVLVGYDPRFVNGDKVFNDMLNNLRGNGIILEEYSGASRRICTVQFDIRVLNNMNANVWRNYPENQILCNPPKEIIRDGLRVFYNYYELWAYITKEESRVVNKSKIRYNAIYNKRMNFNFSNYCAIEKVISNAPATIVMWSDGTKTVVKAEGEKFDKEKGLAMAISKKFLGNKGNYYEEFKKWIPRENDSWADIIKYARTMVAASRYGITAINNLNKVFDCEKDLSPNDYQKLAMRTCGIPSENKKAMLEHATHGLAAEAGDVNGILQKQYRGYEFDKEHMKKELGDCLWMIAEACTAMDITMEDVMKANIQKLKERYPEDFDPDKSLHRKEGDI